ncbi:MAG: Mov34/MPN/PAD-1 family protein [Nitrososphaerales archaeon]
MRSRPGMVDPYPEIRTWGVSAGVVDATLDALDPARHPGVEAGVFRLGPRQSDSPVSAVVIPRGEGVDALPGCWRVTPEVFGRVGSWATAAGVNLLGVVHTHGGRSPARLSRQDRAHLVKAPGVLAVVVAHNGSEPDPDRWGWYVWTYDVYHLLTPPDRAQRLTRPGGTSPSVWRADATGVYPV